MPLRPLTREQTWLLPPTLEELIPADHPARFVAAFVDALDRAAWAGLGVAPDGEPLGAPAYHPRALLGVWLYGFMTGVRSSRKLEAACRDQLPYLWLTGWQRPDHNTLWRFYEAHRGPMRKLLKRTVRTAVAAGLVDLAVQAVDGTKLAGDAAKARTYDAEGLARLLERTEAAVADLEAQNAGGAGPPPPRLPEALAKAGALAARVRAALERVTAEDGPGRTNLTDPDATLMKGRQGYVAGYNGQAMVAPVDPAVPGGGGGLLITAAEVTTDPDDHAQLAPMIERARELTGQAAALVLADGGYHSGPNLADCADLGQAVAMPEAQREPLKAPYHKEAFAYDPDADAYTCPRGQPLRFAGVKRRTDRPPMRVYRAGGAACRACPAFGACTTDGRQGRALEVGPADEALRRHRAWMATEAATAAYRRRKELPEPAFGILKEQQAARRLLLRGLDNVRAEWALLATAFNLRTLARIWRERAPGRASPSPARRPRDPTRPAPRRRFMPRDAVSCPPTDYPHRPGFHHTDRVHLRTLLGQAARVRPYEVGTL
jgi:transposase